MLRVSKNALYWVYLDAQTANDVTVIPSRPPEPVRHPSDDELDIPEPDGRRHAVQLKPGRGPSLSPDASKVAYQGAWHLCNACLSALGYLVKYHTAVATHNAAEAEKPEEERLKWVSGNVDDLRNQAMAALHHWNISALIRSCETGCQICRIVWNRCRPELMQAAVKADSRPRFEMVFNRSPFEGEGDEEGDLRIIVAIAWPTFEGAEKEYQPGKHNYVNVLRLQLWPSPGMDEWFDGNPEGRWQVGVDIMSAGVEPDWSTKNEPRGKMWMGECKENKDERHEACNRRSDPGWLPTRMLFLGDVNEKKRVRIVESKILGRGEGLRYLSLSHCWGEWGGREKNLPTLLQNNIATMRDEGIELASLPQTFQDAVEIAGWYGCEYLWVDSLCIIQDSAEDWIAEASRMADVYKNAELNISADDAVDGRGGCFQERDPAGIVPFKLKFEGQEKSWWVTLDERNLFDWIQSPAAEAPLTNRAWVYQERHLSRRVLHFTAGELFFDCLAEGPSFRSETWPNGSPYKRNMFGQEKIRADKDEKATTVQESAKLRETWQRVVECYSMRKLTYVTDRLPSLSGLARELGRACPDDIYLAGIWKSSLPRALLWSVARPKIDDTPDSPEPIDQSEEYIAPSWSWLSVEEPVKTNLYTSMHPLVDIVSCSTNLLHADPYGRISSASVTLTGLTRRITCTTEPSPFGTSGQVYDLYKALGTAEGRNLYVDGDVEDSIGYNIGAKPPDFQETPDADPRAGTIGTREYECLMVGVQVMSAHGMRKRSLLGLLMEPVEGEEGVYRRVGTIMFHDGATSLRMRYRFVGDTHEVEDSSEGEDEDEETPQSGSASIQETQRRQEDEYDQEPFELRAKRRAWRRFYRKVAPHFNVGEYDEPPNEDLKVDGKGPLSLYEFDGGIEEEGFEKLEVRKITLI